MLKKSIIPIIAFLLLLPSAKMAAQTEYITHTVTKGQGLYSIARTYGVTEDEIISANPGSDKIIKVGEQLRIPVRKADGSRFHTVQAGETLYSLSKANNITVNDICQANPGLDAANVKSGQTIILPAPEPQQEVLPQQNAASAEQAVTKPASDEPVSTVEQTDGNNKYQAIHTVRKKETIYRISKNYGISQAEFLAANPQYRYSKLQPGAQVRIPYPSSQTDREPDKADTQSLQMPVQPQSGIRQQASDQQLTPATKTDLIKGKTIPDTIQAALMMPFCLDQPQTQEQRKMVEFYQGILLALNELKQSRININLHVYDTGSENSDITSILQKAEMQRMHIIFGPRYEKHISQAAAFAQEHQIPLVLPINSTVDAVYTNPYVYQLNTPQSYLMSEVCDHFLRQFNKPRLIILNIGGSGDNTLLEQLKSTLQAENHPCVTINASEGNLQSSISQALQPGFQNIFILSSTGNADLPTLLPVLQLVTRSKDPQIETHLFGYPEYQIYTTDHMEEFYEIDTWFYSWFYTNNQLPEATGFSSSFRQAYGRQMLQSYPCFAEYGYDMALYFLKGIARYGTSLPGNINAISTKPVQMGFKFQRASNWGGFINNKVFFVHLSNNYKVEKMDFDK